MKLEMPKCGHISLKLLPLKATFFCQFGTIAAFFVYINPILYAAGLNTYEIGTSVFIANALSMLTRALFSVVADKIKRPYWLLVILSSLSGVAVILFFLLPRKEFYAFDGEFTEDAIWRTTAVFPSLHSNFAASSVPTGDNTSICWPYELKQCTYSPSDESNHTTGLLAAFVLKEQHVNNLTAMYTWINTTELTTLPIGVPGKLVCGEVVILQKATCVPLHAAFTGHNTDKSGSSSWRIFILALLLRCFASFTHAPCVNLLESATFALLGKDKRHHFGRTRAFGSLGFLVASLVSGFGLYKASELSSPLASEVKNSTLAMASLEAYTNASLTAPQGINYAPSFGLGASFMFFAAIMSAVTRWNNQPSASNYCKTIRMAMKSALMIRCLVYSFLGGLSGTFVYEYLFLIIINEYNPPKYFIGVLNAVMVLCEVPTFFISGFIIKFLGMTTSLFVAFAIWSLQFLSCAFISNYWFFLPAQMGHGVAFSLLLTVLLTQADLVGSGCCKDQESARTVTITMQGLMSAILFGMSSSIGGLMWGILLRLLHSKLLFLTVAGYTFTCGIMYLVWTYIHFRISRTSSPQDLNGITVEVNGSAALPLKQQSDPSV